MNSGQAQGLAWGCISGESCTQLFPAPLADPGHLPDKVTLRRKPLQILRTGAIPKSLNCSLPGRCAPFDVPIPMYASTPAGTAPKPSPDPSEVLNHLKSIPPTGDIEKSILYNYCVILITQHRERFFRTFLFCFFPLKTTLPCSRIPLCDSQAKAALAYRESLKSGLGGGL